MLKRIIIFLSLLIVLCPSAVIANTTDDSYYGWGNYGNCNYGECPITLTSSGAVSLAISPTSSGSCSVQSDSVTVLTDNGAGYTLQLASSATNSNLVNGAYAVSATSGTPASPASLNANSWGYRVDGTYGFGPGPTTAQSSIAAPISSFAGIPTSAETPATIKVTNTSANPAQSTSVWYGVCVDTSIPSGTYSAQVTYTALNN